jgi:hypothetical protein
LNGTCEKERQIAYFYLIRGKRDGRRIIPAIQDIDVINYNIYPNGYEEAYFIPEKGKYGNKKQSKN